MKTFVIVALMFIIISHAFAGEFSAEGNRFILNGAPFQILSGEIHYPRVPKEYWRNRLQSLKAMGLNTVTTYVFWNQHETSPGVYDFTGDQDVAQFIRMAQEEGLYVILRPGPYICAEWEFGGFPAWLLKDGLINLRSNDQKYLNYVSTWFSVLGKVISPLLIQNGGPIIAVQIENEYGGFGRDKKYLEAIHQILLKNGFAQSLMFTSDGIKDLSKGNLSGILSVANFGPGNADEAFEALRKARPEAPLMVGEYWAGWFDEWGGKHQSLDLAPQTKDYEWMLSQGASVNLYMFHGGTSFGWMNGANSDGRNYSPDVTSYDYDSALDESGRPTKKYFAFREIISRLTGKNPSAVPELTPVITLPEFRMRRSISVFDSLPKSVKSLHPLSMEQMDQAYGYILYRARLKRSSSGHLVIEGLHDYAQVYIDGKLVGTLDRRLDQKSLKLNIRNADARLEILVENSGRINYTKAILNERKGITGNVKLSGSMIQNWEQFSLPMNNISSLKFKDEGCEGACFYESHFNLNLLGDTFLDVSKLGKGMVWINGRPLGRIWKIGPQKKLYLPAPWLKVGENVVHVFDLEGRSTWTMKGLSNSNDRLR